MFIPLSPNDAVLVGHIVYMMIDTRTSGRGISEMSKDHKNPPSNELAAQGVLW